MYTRIFQKAQYIYSEAQDISQNNTRHISIKHKASSDSTTYLSRRYHASIHKLQDIPQKSVKTSHDMIAHDNSSKEISSESTRHYQIARDIFSKSQEISSANTSHRLQLELKISSKAQDISPFIIRNSLFNITLVLEKGCLMQINFMAFVHLTRSTCTVSPFSLGKHGLIQCWNTSNLHQLRVRFICLLSFFLNVFVLRINGGVWVLTIMINPTAFDMYLSIPGTCHPVIVVSGLLSAILFFFFLFIDVVYITSLGFSI